MPLIFYGRKRYCKGRVLLPRTHISWTEAGRRQGLELETPISFFWPDVWGISEVEARRVLSRNRQAEKQRWKGRRKTDGHNVILATRYRITRVEKGNIGVVRNKPGVISKYAAVSMKFYADETLTTFLGDLAIPEEAPRTTSPQQTTDQSGKSTSETVKTVQASFRMHEGAIVLEKPGYGEDIAPLFHREDLTRFLLLIADPTLIKDAKHAAEFGDLMSKGKHHYFNLQKMQSGRRTKPVLRVKSRYRAVRGGNDFERRENLESFIKKEADRILAH